MVRAMLSITALTLALAALLAFTHDVTQPRIHANRAAAEWRTARALTGLPDLAGPWQQDHLPLADGRLLLRSVVRGYGGDMHLLAVREGASVTALRVVRHQETPGIGDFVSHHDRGWMAALAMQGPEATDTVTGATITSRAVLNAWRILEATP